MQRFERVVEAGGVLLKAERFAGKDPLLVACLLLTFDVGRLLVEVAPGALTIRTTVMETKDAVPAGMVDGAEEEPWWRVLGGPLSRTQATDSGVRLQFRADADNPRIIALENSGGEVRVTLDPLARN
ncbi:MAG: hypothetical protein VCB43_13920 [Myxococcota bacterium]|jgi:hypothetical protein